MSFEPLSSLISRMGRHIGRVSLNGACMACALLLSVQMMALAQNDTPVPTGRTLTAGVSKSLYLPEEMYGYWSVTGTLLESNAPEAFNRVMHNIWVLEQQGDAVILTNPVNGASASINVERVDGQTATFHHTVVSQKNERVFFEMPTVTVDGDMLYGSTVNEFRYLKNGRVSHSYYAKYKLEARRIGGEKIRFKQNRLQPEIEIDEPQ